MIGCLILFVVIALSFSSPLDTKKSLTKLCQSTKLSHYMSCLEDIVITSDQYKCLKNKDDKYNQNGDFRNQFMKKHRNCDFLIFCDKENPELIGITCLDPRMISVEKLISLRTISIEPDEGVDVEFKPYEKLFVGQKAPMREEEHTAIGFREQYAESLGIPVSELGNLTEFDIDVHTKLLQKRLNLTDLTFTNSSMKEFSKYPIPSSKHFNNINQLSNANFDGHETVQVVNFTGKGFTDIKLGALDSLKGVKVLDLSNNLIRNISKEHFEKMKSLRTLILTGNPLQDTNVKELVGVEIKF